MRPLPMWGLVSMVIVGGASFDRSSGQADGPAPRVPRVVVGGVGFGLVVGGALVLAVAEPGLAAEAPRVGVIGLDPVVRCVTAGGFAGPAGLDMQGGAHPVRERSSGDGDVDEPAVGVEDVATECRSTEEFECVVGVDRGAIDQFAPAINIIPADRHSLGRGFTGHNPQKVFGNGLRHDDVDQRPDMAPTGSGRAAGDKSSESFGPTGRF